MLGVSIYFLQSYFFISFCFGILFIFVLYALGSCLGRNIILCSYIILAFPKDLTRPCVHGMETVMFCQGEMQSN